MQGIATTGRNPTAFRIVGEMSGTARRRRKPDLSVRSVLVDDIVAALVEIDGKNTIAEIDIGAIAQQVFDALQQALESFIGAPAKAAVVQTRPLVASLFIGTARIAPI